MMVLAKAIIGVLGLAAAVGATFWATRTPTPKPQTPIAEQWIQAVRQFGLEPVYPPQEDFIVGDVLAMITDDATHNIKDQPLPTRALKIHHMDMTPELEAAYRDTYQFPETPDPPSNPEAIWRPSAAKETIFKRGAPRLGLPIALLPSFSLASMRGAGLAGSGLAGAFGLAADGESIVEMKVDGVETYGVPALPAEAALYEFCTGAQTARFCTDAGVRTQLSNIVGQQIFDTVSVGSGKEQKKAPRFSVEVALVSRAYLVRSVETSIRNGAGFRANGETPLGTEPPTQKPAAPSEAPKPEAKSETDDAGSKGSDKPSAAKDAAKRYAAAVPLAAPTAPGVRATLRRSDGATVSITKTLARPIVIGFRSVRWSPGK